MNCPDWNDIEKLFSELINQQHARMMKCGQQIVPKLTTDDVLQPNDFPELENHPVFRYEEGILSGIQTAQMALRALSLENTHKREPL